VEDVIIQRLGVGVRALEGESGVPHLLHQELEQTMLGTLEFAGAVSRLAETDNPSVLEDCLERGKVSKPATGVQCLERNGVRANPGNGSGVLGG